jgi:7-cyano-7-deazaguanine reductase
MKEDSLTSLGSESTEYKMDNPTKEMLETFENTAGEIVVPFVCNEFTSLCPKTGQPDFAKYEILYVPDQLCIESKSLKLYLFAYRNHGAFHEDCTAKITDDIFQTIKPKYIRVWGDFNVRGGISIKPMVTKGNYLEYKDLIEQYDRLRHWD